jgi:hypothetical protein
MSRASHAVGHDATGQYLSPRMTGGAFVANRFTICLRQFAAEYIQLGELQPCIAVAKLSFQRVMQEWRQKLRY